MKLVPIAALALLAGVAHARAPGREIVIANESLAAGGKHVPANLERFLRRLEQVAGWPEGALAGKAFVRPREAAEYIRKARPAFAILPPHQFVELRKEAKLEVLGRAVGLEGAKIAYWGVVRSDAKPPGYIEETPGLRLAITEAYDNQWLRVLMDGNVRDPQTHFKLVEVPSANEAIAAVLAKRADVALLYEADFQPLRPRLAGHGADLAWNYTSGPLPPPAVVATGWASKADRKRLAQALAKVCKEDGAEACARMAILYIEPGRADTYGGVINKYDNWR